MAKELVTLDIRGQRQWRAWLAKHHASSAGVWLVFRRKDTGVPSMAYEGAVREALCYGWIDSLVKRLDEHRYARKFTPRSPSSKWSDINRKRWAELKDAGLLAAPGLSAAPTANSYARQPSPLAVPPSLTRALKANPEAWRCFEELAPTYRRHYVGWIQSAKRPDTRERRIRESVALLQAGKKLGLR